MAISPEIRKLLQQTLTIRGSHVPLHRVIDILAMEEGDVSEAVNRFRDIKNPDLRRSFHNLAVLLRELEREAGLTPAWDPSKQNQPASGTAAGSQGQKADTKASPPPAPASPPKPKFRPDELQPFESDEARGKVQVAKMFVDGASKGNPGDAGIGVALFTMDGKKIAQISRAIGTATNNIAEYTALIEGLRMAKRMGVKSVFVLSDSELMTHQINGRYQVKNPDIKVKHDEATGLKKKFDKFTISYVARENNALADALSTAKIKKKKAPPAPEGPEHQDMLPALPDNPDEGLT